MEAVLEDAYVFLFDRKLASVKEMVPLLEQVAKGGRPALLVAEDVEAEVLATLIVNQMRGTFHCVAVKAPGFGDRRKAILEDIAVLTGGQVISQDLGLKLETVTLEQLGRARRIVVDRETTTIVGGSGEKKTIDARVRQLRAEIEKVKSSYDKEKLEERLAKLTGGVAVIRVGAPTEAEMKSRKEALDDAINATKAAVAEGIVPGGGLALLRCTPALVEEEKKVTGDERTGIEILRRALSAPTRQIAENSAVDGGVIVARMLESDGRTGYDAAQNVFVDLVETGIVDPTKVLRVALENAVSVASILLLTEATMTELPEKETASAPEFGM
jgi:chaperonin GroEL